MQITRTTRFLRTILQLRHILLTEARTFIFSPSPAGSRPVCPPPFARPLPASSGPAGYRSAYRTTPVRP